MHIFRKWLLWLCFCAAAFSEAPAQEYTFAGFQRYAEENASMDAPTGRNHRVVFLGNSITEFWMRNHPEFFLENDYINRGIGGQTSYQFLLRFREDVLKLKPNVVVINAGTNDIAENTGPYVEEYTFGNIVSMVELARANRIKVVLTSVLPARQFPWRPSITDAMSKIRALNARIEESAEKTRIPFVDYFSAMVDDQGEAMAAEYAPEGVHPNSKGYAVMEQLIKPVIEKIR